MNQEPEQQYTEAELEVLASVHSYEVRKFLGYGHYQREYRDTLEEARVCRNELKPQAAIYAHGFIASRGGIEGTCFVQ